MRISGTYGTRNILLATLLCAGSISCSETVTDTARADSSATTSAQNDLGDRPIVTVQTVFDDSVYSTKEEIGFTITLLNQTDSNQVVLFDKPKLSTGGPWNTSAELKELDVVKSELRCLYKITMISNSYSSGELIDSSYTIGPGKSITGHYTLADLVAFNTPESKLPAGRYEVQIFYAGHASAKSTIRITK